MEKLFYPEFIAVIGLSSEPQNLSRPVLENLIRRGYKGRIPGTNPLCPADRHEIEAGVKRLKSYKILRGMKGKGAGNIAGYVAMMERVNHPLHQFPQIRELDINPVRVLADGSGVVALDARVRIDA